MSCDKCKDYDTLLNTSIALAEAVTEQARDNFAMTSSILKRAIQSSNNESSISEVLAINNMARNRYQEVGALLGKLKRLRFNLTNCG